jgi:hypothetical protein
MGEAGKTLVSGNGVSSRSSNNGRHGAEGGGAAAAAAAAATMMLMGIVSIDGQLQGQKRITSKQWTRGDTLLTEEMRRSAVSLSFASAVIGQAARIRGEDWRNCWDGRGYGGHCTDGRQLRQETKRRREKSVSLGSESIQKG